MKNPNPPLAINPSPFLPDWSKPFLTAIPFDFNDIQANQLPSRTPPCASLKNIDKKHELLLTPYFQGVFVENSGQESRALSAVGTGAAFNVSRAMRLLASDFAYTESGRMRCAITKPVMHASINGNITS